MTDTQVGKGVAQALADFQAAHKLTLENIALRQQLAEKDAEIESLRQQLVSVTEERDQWKNDAIDGGNAAYLRQELAAANAEIERLKEEVRVTKEEDFPRKAEAVANNWRIKLASSQLREQQLRDALEAVHTVSLESRGIDGWHLNGEIATWDELLPEVAEALTLPTDNTTLREMIAEAGEVMRERCVVVLQDITDEYNDEEVSATWLEKDIIALPGVTLENLQ